jgi:small subunit ribosomal protein S3Ae
MAKKVSTKKPKTKKWVKLVAPKIFNDAELGETLSSQPSKMVGKVIDTSLANLIGDFSKQHFKIKLIVDEVKEGTGTTKIKSIYVSQSHIVRRVRKGSSKIEVGQKVNLKNGDEIMIKTILITVFNAHNAQVKALRKKLQENIIKIVKNHTLESLVIDICANKVQSEIISKLKKTYPIKYLEVIEVEVL